MYVWKYFNGKIIVFKTIVVGSNPAFFEAMLLIFYTLIYSLRDGRKKYLSRSNLRYILGFLLNIALIAIILIATVYFKFSIFYINVLIRMHILLMLIYLFFIAKNGTYTPIKVYRSPNIAEVVFNYFILLEYNSIFNAIYKILSRDSVSIKMRMYIAIMLLYRFFIVLLFGLPYKIIVLI